MSCQPAGVTTEVPFSSNAEASLNSFSSQGVMVSLEGGLLKIEHSKRNTPKTIEIDIVANPIDRFVLSSTTQIHYFEEIAELDKVVGCAWLNDIDDAMIEQSMVNGQIKNVTVGAELDLESILDCRPDVVFYDPRESSLVERLESFDIICIPFLEYLEEDAISRVSWIHMVGLLLGKPKASLERYEKIKRDYNDLRAPLIENDHQRRGVILLSYYNGTWSASGPGSLMAELITDAGGKYALEGDEVGSLNLDIEELLKVLPQTDFVGVIQYGTLNQRIISEWDDRISSEQLDSISFFSVNTKKEDYFGRGILEPEVMLADMKAILNQDTSFHFTYFKPLLRKIEIMN